MKTAALLLVLSTATVFANGGGYTTGVKFTGSVAPFQPEGVGFVQIAKENLDIVLGKKSAAVSVRYEMNNVSTDAVKVRFGFPVEAYAERTGIGPAGPRTKKLSVEESTKYCRNYSVTATGKNVPAKFQTEPVSEGRVPAFPGMEVFKGIGGWMVSEVKFPPQQLTVMEIKFDSDYDSNSYGVDGAGTTEADTFRYRLSTGAVWNGPIAEGTVRVRIAPGLEAGPVQIKAPANKFKKHTDGGWDWNFTALEPTMADDITIHTTETRYYSRDYTEGREGVSVAYERRGTRWLWYHRDYKASASSTLTGDKENNYSAAGLKNAQDYDEDFRAWVEGAEGDGLGESVTITPIKPVPLEAIQIRPGFGKSKELFAANNRPKSLKITLNGSHTFTAALKDEDSFQEVKVMNFNAPVKTIRLEISEVYRGSHYRDTAIADVQLISRLSKEPKFTGPR